MIRWRPLIRSAAKDQQQADAPLPYNLGGDRSLSLPFFSRPRFSRPRFDPIFPRVVDCSAIGEAAMKRLTTAGLLFCFVVFSSALAQTTNATLGGTVSDSTGALIPGVTVRTTNIQTGIASTSTTNETGAYNFPSLETGVYKVSAELSGFQTQSYNDVTLGVSQQVRLNFILQVGSQAQSVEVSVEADTLIATTSASVGLVLPEYRIR